MSLTIKKNFLYKKILTSLLILNFNIISYAQQHTSNVVLNELAFEYIADEFNPLEVASTYIKFSTPPISYLAFGMQVPAYKYMSYTLGINGFYSNITKINELYKNIIAINPVFGIKFTPPFALSDIQIAPYTHLTIGPTIMSESDGIFGIFGTIIFGVDASVNEWIKISAEIQIIYGSIFKSPTLEKYQNNLFVIGLQTTF